MSFSHAVMDGLSRITFMNELLSFATKSSEPSFSLDQIASLPALPSLVDMMADIIKEKATLPPPTLPRFAIPYDYADKLYVNSLSLSLSAA